MMTLRIPAHENDHHLGPLHAPVTIVEYADFECPYSAVVATVMRDLVLEFERDLCFVFRHYALRGIHPMAEHAALAAEASDLQGKFWEMHKLLFENQDHLSKDLIELLARKLNLDMDEYHHDIQRYDLVEKIRNDQRGGNDSGVESTPTIFINGTKFEGSSSYWPLREAIEIELGGPISTSL